MPHVEATQMVQAQPDEVYRIAGDMESYPAIMDNVDSVVVTERGDGYTHTAWDTRLHGRRIKWTERDDFDPENLCIRYHLLEGDLKKFEGEWRFEPAEGGTKVTLTVDFDFGIPTLAAILNPVARLVVKENCRQMLEAIKARAEE